VCEGCGDCSVQSNCLSVEPVETEFGRKRRINQSSCNQDFTCADGFCPSFVSVTGGEVKRAAVALDEPPHLPEPTVPALGGEPFNILLAGVGGLGVTSLADILGEAAHLDGREVHLADQTGLAQKGGAVTSHIRIGGGFTVRFQSAHRPKQLTLLTADAVVAHGKASLPFLSRERTAVIADSHVTPTAEFVANNAVRFDSGGMMQRLKAAARTVDELPATDLAATLLGDAIYANMLLLGYAWQRGLVPVSGEAIARAIELNGARVAENKRAFALGREAALDKAAVLARLAPPPQLSRTPGELLAIRMRHLEAYQDAAYAARYKAVVDKVRARETEVAPGSDRLTTAVARSLHKLMAVKDEYEVARLFTDGAFERALKAQFGGQYRLAFHMAPPFLPVFDAHTRRPVKRTFGPWMLPVMRLLARMKRWRGTWLDIFNRTAERRRERALAADYMARLERLLPVLTRSNLPLAVEYAGVPDMIRGFGHVKARNIEAAGLRYAELEAALFAPSPFRLAAE
jgi:indolepyruvate ferredoxin oxidoreductase